MLRAVSDSGYDIPTEIQAQAIPSVLMMRDLIGVAQTGTGKTASFVLPMIDVLAEGRSRALMPRSLILEPTRELAAQVAENFDKYGKYHKLTKALLIGGVSMGDQIKALEKGVDVLIATPGRLMDLFDRGNILLNGCSLLVIDEADRMLDMGFIPDIEHICTKLPTNRQTLLFSATMPKPIKKLADRFLTNPKSIEVARPASTNANIEEIKVAINPRRKRALLRHYLSQDDMKAAIVFCNRKTTVRELSKSLKQNGYSAGEIHGDVDQSVRQSELERFRNSEIAVIVASDVAARGIDVKHVSHVFNFDVPWHPDDYVHRVGRTGRAGAKGIAISFVTDADLESIANIEQLTGKEIAEHQDPTLKGASRGKTSSEKPARARAGSGKTANEKTADRKSASEKPARASSNRGKPAGEKRAASGSARKSGDDRASSHRETRKQDSRSQSRLSDKQGHSQHERRGKSGSSRQNTDDDNALRTPGEQDDPKWRGPVPDFLAVTIKG